MTPLDILRIIFAVGLSISGALRLLDPRIAEAEMQSLWVFTPTTEFLIAIFELMGVPVLLFGNSTAQFYYLAFFCACVVTIGALYLPQQRPEDIPLLVAYTGDMKTLLYHGFVVIIGTILMIGLSTS